MKAMLFAAGKGTRLKPLTDQHPKCLVRAGGKTLLEHNLDFLKRAGITTVVINTHHHQQQVVDFLKTADPGLEIILSPELELLETGGGLLQAREHFLDEEDFVVCNSDIYTELNLNGLIGEHRANRNVATLAVAHRETSRYLRFNSEKLLCGWENRSTGESLSWNSESYQLMAFNGLQVLSPAIFEHMDGLGSIFSTIAVYLKAAQAGGRIQAFPMDDAYWIDVGTLEKLELLRAHLKEPYEGLRPS